MEGDLRVHIAPVGYQHARVTEPLISMRADRVHLVRHTTDSDAASWYYENIRGELAKRYKHIEIEVIRLDLWDIHACIEAFRGIMKKSQNRVYVNVSTGTKITAIAGMLACMMWDARPYYARVSYQTKLAKPPSEHVDDSVFLPVYDIKKPRPEFVKILSTLKSRDGRARKSALIRDLEGLGMIRARREDGTEPSAPAKHNQLNALLGPMESEWDLVSIETHGRRSEVLITEQGEEALKIFGAGGG